jgi:hypothetical protein
MWLCGFLICGAGFANELMGLRGRKGGQDFLPPNMDYIGQV